MPTVSEQLRRAREEQKLDIYQVAEITKIKTDHVRALESGNFEMFSAPVYIRGFIRNYATMLRLDVPRVLAELDKELGHSEKFHELPSLTNQPRGLLDFLMLQLSRLNWRIAFALAAVGLFLILSVAVIRNRAGKKPEPPPDTGPGLYQPRQNHSGELLPLPPPPAK
jgi:cytoskeletal protein RodZ